MATVDYSSGEYIILAGAKTTFTFWFNTNHQSRHFLDVTPWPLGKAVDKGLEIDYVQTAARLTQIDKSWIFDGVRYTLLLTLQNEEDFDVVFRANHCFVTY